MRSLGQPKVLKQATAAALVTFVACFPRLWLAPQLKYPLWYLGSLLFLASIVLWAFVLAWHSEYTGRPVFTFKVPLAPFIAATSSGLAAIIVLQLWVDPQLRARSPSEYPVNLEQWLVTTLFSLAFTQLFLVFAPFAWLMRLFQKQGPA